MGRTLRRPERIKHDGDVEIRSGFVVQDHMFRKGGNEVEDYLGMGEYATGCLEVAQFLVRHCGWDLEQAMLFQAQGCQDCNNIVSAFAAGEKLPPEKWDHTQCDWCRPIKKNWDNLSEGKDALDWAVRHVLNETRKL